MKTPVFTGTCTALITPFLSTGAIDYTAFAKQIDRQLEAGIDALCVCGTTGESAALSSEEHVKLVDYCGDELNVWSGNDDQTLPMLALGAKGLISVVANLVPSPMAELTHSYFRGETDQARALQLAYFPLMKAVFTQVNPIPIKAAMEALGLDSGQLRRPLWTMDSKPRKALLETLRAFELLP